MLFDNVPAVPPCRICKSTAIKKDDLRIDFIRGHWKGEGTCEKGHKNTL